MKRLVLALVLVASPAWAVDHNGTSAKLGWTPASGPVAGYEVHVKRGTGAFVKEQDVTALEATISGVAGETVIVKVRAYSANKATFGNFSVDSDPVTFKPIPGVPGKPTWIDLIIAWIKRILGVA